MKTALFGGSFDPVHFGHLAPIQECRIVFGFDRILYMPARQPPHKPGRTLAPPHHRLAMLALALSSLPFAVVDPLELESPSGMTTFATLKALESGPGSFPDVIIGSDNLAILSSWHRARDLLRMTRFIVLDRPGLSFSEARAGLPPELAALCSPVGDRIVTFPHDPIRISASEIRSRRRRGESLAGLTPRPVEDYIERNHLYAPSP